jgi:hypothetical protein
MPNDLILRSLAQQGVSKDGHTCCGLWPSFETRAKARSFRTRSNGYLPGCLKYRRSGGAWFFLIGMM